jgi:hypothetical protein
MSSAIAGFTVLNLGIHLNVGIISGQDVVSGFQIALYTGPWVRITPYIMGILTAINLHESLNTPKVSDWFEFLLFNKKTFSRNRNRTCG